MYYIVLDMEWNQAWPGSHSAQRAPSLRGEIIQIGAVRLSEDLRLLDEYQKLVFPHFFHKLNKRVAQLTGITDDQLRDHGLPFPVVAESFRDWCGEDCVFLTWGYDDIPMLRDNLAIHGLDSSWVDNWYNLQLIFNAQTDGSSSQKALKTAMEIFGIDPIRRAHDALGDAYHTALICARLDMKRGLREYKKAQVRSDEAGADIPGCLQRKVFTGYKDRETALQTLAKKECLCLKCHRRMTVAPWISQQGHRYMAMATCAKHGDIFLRVRLVPEADGSVRAIRLMYESDSEAASSYHARIARSGANRQASEAPDKKRNFFFRFRKK